MTKASISMKKINKNKAINVTDDNTVTKFVFETSSLHT